MDEIKAKTKRKEIEEMLATGKTEKEILLATNFDRSYIWTIHQKYQRAQAMMADFGEGEKREGIDE